MKVTTIPFKGYYNSIHSFLIDDYIDQEEINWESVNYSEIHKLYAKEYAEYFAKEHEIELEFESLHSPKFYNFSTDRIFAHISLKELKRIFFEVDIDDFKEEAKKRFTSCPGFTSFYNPDIDKWGDIEEWDHNQYGTLISAYVGEFEEDHIMKDFFCNGGLYEVLEASGNYEYL